MPMHGFAVIPAANHYVLRNAHLPAVLVDRAALPTREGFIAADLVIAGGMIESILPPGLASLTEKFDLRGGMVLPGFIDMHVHLDKGHIWPRAPNPDGSFMGAIAMVPADRSARWNAGDVAARMEFSLRSAYAHGTVAIRTHLDSLPPQNDISWPVFEEMRDKWRGRIDLQAVALVHADAALEPDILEQMALRARQSGGLLGCAAASHPRMREVIAALVGSAARHGLDLDLHLDETLDPHSNGLNCLAEEVLRTGFPGKITAGHCCALSQQPSAEAARTIELVARAGISIVSLPMCNLYLQDRESGRTARTRGVTLLRELAAAGVPTAIASDNTRDPFYAYGDLDALEVLREGVRIAHLDHPVEEAVALVTRNPARIMGLPDRGRIAPGLPADLVLLEGRNWSEVLSRPESRRTVLRAGRPIDQALPDYRELDALLQVT